MNGSLVKGLILPAIVIIAGFAALTPLSDLTAARKPVLPESYADSDLYVKGRDLRGYLLGTDSLAADWYWMSALQYIGDKVVNYKEDLQLDDLRALNPRLLYPLLDSATDLDPHFLAPYTYGAMVLPAIDGDQAVAITKKGIANNPDAWRLYQHLGYIYWRAKHFDEAAAAYEAGSKIEGAAPFMRLMAASMKSEGGSRTIARAIYQEMYASAPDDAVKKVAESRLQELQWFDERDAIDAKLAEAKARTGECPQTLNDIIPALLTVKLPAGDLSVDARGMLVDPTGAPYKLDREQCRVAIDRNISKLPLETK
ncbi:MAG: hypothetical protein UZ17_ACD001000194 [Acidobacteria bacterium OLB17]|nr:MAG: hypothetical protein UZ17_ACD001000194 [Acidobacteria bacterium OLB17]MCZ2389667.1 hypothetical protein [Acidobacteriota bacterium]